MIKRGLADVIVVLLIVLISISGIAIIWVAVSLFLSDSESRIDSDLSTSYSIPMSAPVYIDPLQKKVSLIIQKDSGDREVSAVDVILKDSSGNTISKRQQVNLVNHESARVELSYAGINDIDKINLNPVYKIENKLKSSAFSSQNDISPDSETGIGGRDSIESIGKFKGNVYYIGPKGIVGYWKFDETQWSSPGSIKDSSGKNNHGKAFNGLIPSSVKAIKGNSALFDGIDDYITIPVPIFDDDSIDKEMTISFWVRPECDKGKLASPNYIFVSGQPPVINYYEPVIPCKDEKNTQISFLGINEKTSTGYINNKFVFAFYGFNYPRSNISRVLIRYIDPSTKIYQSFNAYFPFSKYDDTWSHVTFIINPEYNKFYVNGREVRKNVMTQNFKPSFLNNGELWIGRLNLFSSVYFQGAVDEFMIFNRSLSDEEVFGLYDSLKPD